MTEREFKTVAVLVFALVLWTAYVAGRIGYDLGRRSLPADPPQPAAVRRVQPEDRVSEP